MLDEKPHNGRDNRPMPLTQLSLTEMFFIINLSALSIWVYVYVSPFLAVVAGSVLLFVLILKQLGKRSIVIGGLAGFGVSTLLCWLACLVTQVEISVMIAVVSIGPSVGYVAGGFITELADED